MSEHDNIYSWLALIPFGLLLFVALFGMILSPGFSALQKGDYVKMVENYADIGTSYTIYELNMNNPAPTTIKQADRPVIEFTHADGKKAPSNLKIEIKNATDKTWSPFEYYDLGKTFPAGTKFYIRVSGQTINGTKTDNILSTFGFSYPEYAWWNVSFGERKPYVFTNGRTFNKTFVANFENITYNASMVNDFRDLRKTFQYANGTEIPLNYVFLENVPGSFATILYILPVEYSGNTTTYTYWKNSTPIIFGNSSYWAVGTNGDDFNDASFNSTHLTLGGTCTTSTESGGLLRLGTSDAVNCYAYFPFANSGNSTLFARANMSVLTYNDNGIGFYKNGIGLPLAEMLFTNNAPPNEMGVRTWNSSSNYVPISSLGTACNNKFCWYQMTRDEIGNQFATRYNWGAFTNTTTQYSASYNWSASMRVAYVGGLMEIDKIIVVPSLYPFASGTYGASEYLDTTAPYFDLCNPPNASTYNATANVSFGITASDNVALSMVRFYFGNATTFGLNATNSSPFNSSPWNFTITDLPISNYTYYFWANDTAGNFNSTNNCTFSVVNASIPPTTTTTTIPTNGTSVDVTPIKEGLTWVAGALIFLALAVVIARFMR